jgi:hypothetical protein
MIVSETTQLCILCHSRNSVVNETGDLSSAMAPGDFCWAQSRFTNKYRLLDARLQCPRGPCFANTGQPRQPATRAISTVRPAPAAIVNEYFPNPSFRPAPSVFCSEIRLSTLLGHYFRDCRCHRRRRDTVADHEAGSGQEPGRNAGSTIGLRVGLFG